MSFLVKYNSLKINTKYFGYFMQGERLKFFRSAISEGIKAKANINKGLTGLWNYFTYRFFRIRTARKTGNDIRRC